MSVNPRIASIENLIAADPGGRNIFGLVVADQLRLAAQSLRLARKVTIVSGFFIPEASAGETDGPHGAKVLGEALQQLGIAVDYVTDAPHAPLFRALGLTPIVPAGRTAASGQVESNPTSESQAFSALSAQQHNDDHGYLDAARPTHLVSIERVGRGPDGRYRNMRGLDITSVTAPLDDLFIEASRRGLTTIGIGDGGNEIGMGRVFSDALADIPNGATIASIVLTDFCIAAGVSNWGAYGLTGALSVLEGRDLLPPAQDIVRDVERLVAAGGAVDGVTHRHEPTVDGLDIAHSIRMLESIRRHIAPSPFEKGESLVVGILGYGQAGRSAASLLTRNGHHVRISEEGVVTLDSGTIVDGVETGGHTIDFLARCDLVVASPGVRADAPIFDSLHRRGIAVMSELEAAYQLCDRDLIAVTGTVGKRTTVELLQELFRACGVELLIGGNRGLPLSRLLLESDVESRHFRASSGIEQKNPAHESPLMKHMSATERSPIALAISSFQLETVVHFRPSVAILLNIDKAHMDRHRSIAEYVRTKCRVFMNQRPQDALILNFDDDRLRPLARKRQGRTFFTSCRQAVDRGAWLADGMILLNLDGRVISIGKCNPPFPENLLSAVVTLGLYGVPMERISAAIGGLDQGTGRRERT